MELYQLRGDDEPIQIYSRIPQDIIDVVRHYHEQAKNNGELDDPKLAKWVRQIPSLGDIARVDSGFIRYHVGMINLNSTEVDMNEDLFSERMQVTDDFEVAVSPESISYFDQHRRQFPNLKRGDLYKLQIQGIFGGLYFIPEDVMTGIVGYDLTPHYKKSKGVRELIQKVKKGHPNLA